MRCSFLVFFVLSCVLCGCGPNAIDPLADNPTIQPAPPAKAENFATTTVINSRIKKAGGKQFGEDNREVIVTWRNTGPVAIRAVDAVITLFDSSGEVCDEFDYTIYAVGDSSPGIAPGKVYTDPKGEGFALPSDYGTPHRERPKKVKVRITLAEEHAGF